jgi:ankyrin repeat protein
MDSSTSRNLKEDSNAHINMGTLPAEMLVEIFSEFEIHQAAKASGISRKIYAVVQDIWRRRTLRHFSLDIAEGNTKHISNWINEFREQSRVYMNLTPELARLHYLTKEGRISEVMRNIDLPLKDILQMDNKQNSLLSLAKRRNDQRLLDFYYQCALRYFRHETQDDAIDTRKRDTEGNSILHWAILCAQPLDIISTLIIQGCNVNSKNSMGDTSLITAVHCRQIAVVQLLLEHHVDIDWKDCTAQSAAYIAADTGQLPILRILANAGADLNAPAFNHGEPIRAAAINGDVNTVEFLLDHDANIEADYHSSTPLLLAVENNHHKLAENLLRRGANIYEFDVYGRSSIHLAADQGNLGMLSTLVEHGATVDARDADQKTPLHHAVEAQSISLVKFLISNGANPSAADRTEHVTALHLAAKLDNPEIMKILLGECVKVNAAMTNGSTPLFVAAYYGKAENVDLLLKKKANIALAKNNPHRLSLLYVAAMNGHLNVVNILLKQGVDINETCLYGRTALYAAVKRGHLAVAKRLLEQGANPNIANASGRSPLHIAAKRPDAEMTRLLLSCNANPDMELIRSGFTPMVLAQRHGNVDVANIIANEVNTRKLNAQLDAELEASSVTLSHTTQSRRHSPLNFFNRKRNMNTNHNNRNTPAPKR